MTSLSRNMWHICSKQELCSQRSNRCWGTALKQRSFLGNDHETRNGTIFLGRQQILNKREYMTVARERLRNHVDRKAVKRRLGDCVKWPRVSYKEGRSLTGAAVQRGLEHGSIGIAIVRDRCQAATNEDTAGWKGLSVCCRDLQIGEISDSVIIKCN
jgi:hypothetical protein